MRGANAVLIAVIGGAFAVGPWLVPGFGFMSPRIALAQEAGLGGPDLQETLDPAEIGQGVPLPPGVVPGAAEAIAHEEEDAEDAADVENEAVEDEEEAKVVEAPRPAPPVRVPITPRLDRAFGGNQKAGPARGRIFVENDLVNMDFADADIQDVVKQISEITGKNFILDERVRGKITIISPSKITIEEAYRVFESVLQVKGFTTIPVGDFIKIVPLREAKESYIETYPGGDRLRPHEHHHLFRHGLQHQQGARHHPADRCLELSGGDRDHPAPVRLGERAGGGAEGGLQRADGAHDHHRRGAARACAHRHDDHGHEHGRAADHHG
jgi:hypothetical protein